MKHGIRPQLSLWDISPAVISQLKQVYSDQEAEIFDRPATIADVANSMPDLLLIDPPDLSLVESLLAFVPKAAAVIIWLPILYSGNSETKESQNARQLCENKGLKMIAVKWGGPENMRGCRIVYSVPADGANAMQEAISQIVSIYGWELHA